MSETISFSGGNFQLPSEVTNPSTPVTVEKTPVTIDGVNENVFLVTPDKGNSIKSLTLNGTTDGTPIFVDSKTKELTTNFGSSNDTLIIGDTSSSKNGSLNFGDGADNFDTKGSLKSSNVDTGNGNDQVSIDLKAKNTDISMGAGNDTLVFGGNVQNAEISLGSGADKLSFGGQVKNTSIDLGGDTNIDTINFQAGSKLGSVIITGAGNNDVLFIGSTQYNFNSSSNTWINTQDSTDTRQF